MLNDTSVTIEITPGFCACGCGGRTSGPKRMFLQGHDARLKGELITAGREDLAVILLDNSTGTPKTKHVALEEALALFSEPLRDKVLSGVAREAKPRAAKAASSVVVAKVGRWPYEGTIKGDVFHYVDGNGNRKTAAKFTVVSA